MRGLVLLSVGLLAVPTARAATVTGSRHDFSVTGPGPFRAVSETSPCVFCHASHGAGRSSVLTSRPDPKADHRPYESSTARDRPGAPTGASRACLSCHDGTIAVGRLRHREIQMAGPDTIPTGHRANLGTDLRGSHPVSFRPGTGSGVHPPDSRDAVRLDAAGEIQCTSCHDPHVERADPVVGKFLVKPSAASALCLSCHDSVVAAGAESSHARSSAGIPGGLSPSSFETLAEAGCAACHLSHGADPGGRLLRGGRTDDDRCLACHGAGGGGKPIGADVRKPWSHAADGRPGHDPAERALAGKGISASARRHVTCVDCHEPHAASGRRAQAPAAGGALAGVWGVDSNGVAVERVRFEYEVCFKCHGDTARPDALAGLAAGDARRALPDVNLRLVFSPSSPSSHPVVAPSRSPGTPGLLAPYSAGSMIYCTDCHASDAAPSGAPRGPHGSIYPHLLERAYATADPTPESPFAYALCYKCHDRDVLLSDQSGFPLHRSHVVDRSASCATCHDAHGVSYEAGNARENAHLVSFNLRVVGPGAGGRAVYVSDGPRHGSCNLTCHGSSHDGVRTRY